MFEGNERYTRPEILGEGAMGRVYRVHDRDNKSEVALKMLHSVSADRLLALKDEFRGLVDIDHRNLLRLHNLVVKGETPFFTMELVEGIDFRAWVRLEPGGLEQKTTVSINGASGTLTHAPPPAIKGVGQQTYPRPLQPLNFDEEGEARFKDVLKQLAEGLVFLHRSGRFHRDIKPSNVFVESETGRVVVLDFGLVELLRKSKPGQWRQIAGTPAYMAPEQFEQEQLGPECDWYAVGTMLYEALAGRLPYLDQSMLRLMVLKTHPPAPLRHFCQTISKSLNDLVMALLHPDRRQRAGASDILGWCEGAEVPSDSQINMAKSSSFAMGGLGSLPEVFVGRQSEQDRLDHALKMASAGRAQVACVRGISGMGKTGLMRQFLRGVSVLDTAPLVFESRCQPQEVVSFRAVDGAVDDMCRLIMREPKLHGILRGLDHAEELVQLFPVLEAVPGLQSRGAPKASVSPLEQQRRGFGALRSALVRLSEDQPVVLWLDDLQWGDFDSLRLLRDLLHNPDGLRVLVILSFRSEGADQNPFLCALLDEEQSVVSADTHHIQLGRLKDSESTDLIHTLMSRVAAHPVLDVGAMLDEAEGSPFWLRELLQCQLSDISTTDAPLDLKDVIIHRVASLSSDEQRVLEWISMSVQPLSLRLLKQLEKTTVAVPTSAERLRRRAFLRLLESEDDVFFEPYHDKIREALLDNLPAETRRTGHRKLAEVLLTVSEPDPNALLFHMEQAQERGEAFKWALKAARRATEALAFAHAAELYLKALELNEDVAQVSALQEALGESWANCGRGLKAAQAFEASTLALDKVEGKGRKAHHLRLRAAEQYLRSGHLEPGTDLMSKALGAVGVTMPRTSSAKLMTLLYHRARLRLGGVDTEGEANASDLDQEAVLRLSTCWSAASSFTAIDPLLGYGLAALHLREALETMDTAHLARGLAFEANVKASEGGPARDAHADTMRQRAEVLAEQTEDPSVKADVALWSATSAYMQVRWKDSHSAATRAIALYRDRGHGVDWEINTAQNFANTALVRQGLLVEVANRLPNQIQSARDRGDVLYEAGLATGPPNVVWLAQDSVETARRHAEHALSLWTFPGIGMAHYLHTIASVQIDLYEGQGQRALERVGDMFPKLKKAGFMRLQSIRAELWHLEGRALLAANAPLKPIRAVIKRLRKEHSAWALPLAGTLEAGVFRVEGHMEAAVASLEDAAIGFEAIDMSLNAAASRFCAGRLVKGEPGAASIQSSSAWMVGQGIQNTESMVRMLMPGVLP